MTEQNQDREGHAGRKTVADEFRLAIKHIRDTFVTVQRESDERQAQMAAETAERWELTEEERFGLPGVDRKLNKFIDERLPAELQKIQTRLNEESLSSEREFFDIPFTKHQTWRSLNISGDTERATELFKELPSFKRLEELIGASEGVELLGPVWEPGFALWKLKVRVWVRPKNAPDTNEEIEEGMDGKTISRQELLELDIADLEAKKRLRKVESYIKEKRDYGKAHATFFSRLYKTGLRVINAKNEEEKKKLEALERALEGRLQKILNEHLNNLVEKHEWEEIFKCLHWFRSNIESDFVPVKIKESTDLKVKIKEDLLEGWSDHFRIHSIDSLAKEIDDFARLGLVEREELLPDIKSYIETEIKRHLESGSRYMSVVLSEEVIRLGLMTHGEIVEINPIFEGLEN